MKRFLFPLVITFVSITTYCACNSNNSRQESKKDATQKPFVERYDSVFDVHGPVKSVAFSVECEPENYDLEFTIAKVDYLPRGNRWNIVGNNKLKMKSFWSDANNLLCKFQMTEEEEFSATIVYTRNSETKRYDERTFQCGPEGDGCGIKYLYDEHGKLTSAELILFIWNHNKNGFDEYKSILSVKDNEPDQYGNWTERTLSNSKNKIKISRTIEYYKVEEIPTDHFVFNGDSIKANEVVGDFNGDGKIEKAWVNCADGEQMEMDEYVEMKLSFTDKQIETASLGEGLGCSLYNVGDINGDGCDDIGMIPYQMTSAWRGYYVWVSNKGKDWQELTSFTIRPEELWDERGENFIPIRRTDNGIVEYWTIHFNDDIDSDELWYNELKQMK